VYLNPARDAFVRDVELLVAENGIVVAAFKNVTVTGSRRGLSSNLPLPAADRRR